MSFDDIVYFICLLSSIAFGKYYREIKDDCQRKLIGTGAGLLIIFIVSGVHIVHTFISCGICALIIVFAHPRKCHLITFGFMFAYLAFFRTTAYFGIPYPPGHTNMIQMLLTMKLVGLAFEKNSAYNKLQDRESALNDPAKKDEAAAIEITDYDVELQGIDMAEILHYAFNYIGILTGPYYRYRTYRDYFETPFRLYAKSTEETISKLLQTAFYVSLYLLANFIWPLDYAMNPAFYEERTTFYRFMYIWPSFFIFRTRIFSGLILGEAVCSNAGFGSYPAEVDTISGEGPRKSYWHLKRDAEKHSYDFNTILNMDVRGFETCYTFREGMKYWNICIQYWLAVNIYKRFPSKKYRQIAVLLTSCFWHGIHSGYYMCIMGAAFYVPIEQIYINLLRKNATGFKAQLFDVLMWCSKFFTLCYLGIAFLLLSREKIWFYYNSIYHVGYIYFAIMTILSFVLLKLKGGKNREKRQHEGGQEPMQEKKVN